MKVAPRIFFLLEPGEWENAGTSPRYAELQPIEYILIQEK
jgi:hypothetical protein